jgi:glycosyltransferase involved in cell wall biosynthesis
MTTFGIAMVKDEADIIEGTICHMLREVDEVLVLDNGSTDGTREILETLPITLEHDPDPAYYQSQKTSRLAGIAAERGARWIVPFDADERWGSNEGRLADVLYDCDADIVAAALFDHVATSLDDGDEVDPVKRLGWRRREALGLPKVAVRALSGLTIHQGNHGASFETVRRPRVIDGRLQVHHYPVRSPEQMIRKARNGGAAYAATDLPEEVGKHWRDWNVLSDDQLADAFRVYWWSEHPESDPKLIFDPIGAIDSRA